MKCLHCNKPLSEHRKYTQDDINASMGATYDKPVNGYCVPLSPSLIGQWVNHDPLFKGIGYLGCSCDLDNARLIVAAPELLNFTKLVSRSACLKQEFGGMCICFSCEAKRLLEIITT